MKVFPSFATIYYYNFLCKKRHFVNKSIAIGLENTRVTAKSAPAWSYRQPSRPPRRLCSRRLPRLFAAWWTRPPPAPPPLLATCNNVCLHPLRQNVNNGHLCEPCLHHKNGLPYVFYTLKSRTTISRDVQTRFPVQLAFAKFLSKIREISEGVLYPWYWHCIKNFLYFRQEFTQEIGLHVPWYSSPWLKYILGTTKPGLEAQGFCDTWRYYNKQVKNCIIHRKWFI